MSPTLLELVVALLLLLAAWKIGVAIAPPIFAAIAAFWRGGPKFPPPDNSVPERHEKNITPPSQSPPPPPIPPTGNPRKNHGFPR